MKKISLMKSKKVSNICKKEFTNKKNTNENDKNAFKLNHKVRDYCHYTGKFRAAAHSICNLRKNTPKEILAVFYNGSRYDYHFIISLMVSLNA